MPLFLFLFLFWFNTGTSQQLTPVVMASAGTDNFNQNYHLSWTLGEVAIHTQSQTEATLLQGFQQPNFFFDAVEESETYIQLSIYPNPTSDWITIKVIGREKFMRAELWDLFGKRLIEKNIETPEIAIDLSELPSATYLLKVIDDNKESVRFWRVQKLW